MKKTLSLILAVIMALTVCVCAFGAFAAEGSNDMIVCKCDDCTKIPGQCHCCAACPYLDTTYLVSCAKNEYGHFKGSFCCKDCTGIWPCNCSCGCKACSDKNDTPDDFEPVLTPNQQQSIIKGFQAVMKKISDIFDKIFDTIFEFLRIGEIFR